MQLKYCSITGADDDVVIDDLSEIARRYPFLENAILLLPSRMGQARFPTDTWITKFSSSYSGKHRAMHLCEDALLGFIAGDKEVLRLMHGFQRIQLNLKFGNIEGRYDPLDLVNRVKETPEKEFIIQYSKDKHGLLPLFRDVKNHAVLYDDSAGRGISPDSWDAPLEGHFCGYAGGMNPDNVGHNLEIISKVAEGYVTWIDMETGVRTNDCFDLSKVERVLEIVEKWPRTAD